MPDCWTFRQMQLCNYFLSLLCIVSMELGFKCPLVYQQASLFHNSTLNSLSIKLACLFFCNVIIKQLQCSISAGIGDLTGAVTYQLFPYFLFFHQLKFLNFASTCLFTFCNTIMPTEFTCSYHITRKNGARHFFERVLQ